VVAFNEQVQNIEKSKASIVKVASFFAKCEGKNSRETIRCEYRAKLKQH